MYADIAVCLPLTRTFAYELTEPVEVGCRVVVPFRKREVDGFVVGIRGEAPKDVEVRAVDRILDRAPLVGPDIFKLCRWISDYYIAPLGEVLKSSLPPGISAKHVEGGVTTRNFGFRERNPKSPALSPRPTLTGDQTGAFNAIQS